MQGKKHFIAQSRKERQENLIYRCRIFFANFAAWVSEANGREESLKNSRIFT
jgi:hypothetical protein